MAYLESTEPSETAEVKQKIEELFLLELRYREARQLDVGSNRPILLNDPGKVWVIYSGSVNVFAVRVQDGKVSGARFFLFQAEGGEALFGMNVGEDGYCLMAVGSVGTRLLQLKRDQLSHLIQNPDYLTPVTGLMDNWVTGLTSGIFQRLPPKDCRTINSEQKQIALTAEQMIRPSKHVLWVRHESGNSDYMGQEYLALATPARYVPVPRRAWLHTASRVQLTLRTTSEYITHDFDWSDLDEYHRLMLLSIQNKASIAASAERDRMQQQEGMHQASIENAFSQLASILQTDAAVFTSKHVDGNALLQACELVGEAMNIAIQPPPNINSQRNQEDLVNSIAKASKIRIRQVALKGDWWVQDNGPLLAYLEANEQPVALLPTSSNKYLLHNPAERQAIPVTRTVAEKLRPFAFTFYRSFPVRPLTAFDLLKFGLSGRTRELAMVALMASGVAILGLLTPLATGIIFDAIIPGSVRSQLLQISIVLLASAVAGTMFLVTQSVAMLRLEGKMDATLQAAVWDRLLNLPIPFFREFSAGDLGLRAMGISAIRRTLSGATISSILSGLFSIFNFALLFYYDASLAWIAMALVLLAVVITGTIGYVQVRYQRGLSNIEGQISGMVLQFITGMTKLRVAGAESRVFAFWARDFSRQRKQSFKVRTVANWLTVFKSTYPLLTTVALFAMISFSGEVELSTGRFVAFLAAFTQLLLAGLQLSFTMISALSVVPTYERLRPILQTEPEIDEAKTIPGELSGEIEVSHASFRYREDGPLILKDVSIYARPGEFVALVGPSGSGKSTIFRLLLGFEKLATGAVYYDGQDLAHLDIQAVRRQLGVVLQNGRLMAGTIFTNIVGSSLLTINDAWDAAKMVALDEDVMAMPMGMHTVVTEGGGTLSGGQRQRLLIARAVVRKPRILLFDEATSALDNKTQAVVSKSLENLQATRIVIAHRLSTIMNADRIYVLQDGQVVQCGTYDELVSRAGLFAELAKRQMA